MNTVEGKATLLTNDHQTSTGPLVGGHLSSFRREWLEENCSDNILNIIIHGYVLPIINKPSLTRQPLIISGYKDH